MNVWKWDRRLPEMLLSGSGARRESPRSATVASDEIDGTVPAIGRTVVDADGKAGRVCESVGRNA